MRINVEVLIYSYMALCFCILLYNIIFIGYNKTEKSRSLKKTNKWMVIIDKQLKLNNDLSIKKHQKLLTKKLIKINQLYIYDEAIQMLIIDKPQQVTQYLQNNIDVFVFLSNEYSNKESIEKAYFTFILNKYLVFDEIENTRIAKIIVNYCIDKSVYCRENALRLLYNLGNEEFVILALKLMNKNNLYHHSKLITDGLLLFKGDSKKLCSVLWAYFNEFDSSYQIAFIDYIKIVSGDFCEEFLKLLKNSKTNQEVKFAIIRYFRKYYYDPVKEYLLNCLKFDNGLDYTYSTLAASALENYPSEETINVLKSSLSSSNWYTRYNAANSLLKLGVDYLDLLDIYNGDDRYAREMIKYKMVEHNI